MNLTIDKIIRSKRTTLALEVTEEGQLIVRAPKRVSSDYIEDIVLKKQSWIQKRQCIALSKYKKSPPKKFVNGELFFYLGKTYPLVIVDNSNEPILFDQAFRLSKNCLLDARKNFLKWYIKEALNKIKERIDWYSAIDDIKYKKISITNAFKRWGSCSAKGSVCFSWRLIMAPLNVIDYVVVHELAHIREQNHSKRFWEKVERMFPHYKESRVWLKDNQHLLRI